MNIEEKAKAYDEAVKKAREIAANPNRILQLDDFEELFPGISDESEDERIRKEIVGVIQKHYPNTPESYRWISWLEKHKEQKPVEWSEEDRFKLDDAITAVDVAIAVYEEDSDHPTLLEAFKKAKSFLKSLRTRLNAK